MLAGFAAAFLYPFALSDENVKVEVIHMRFACGDCHVQYRVLKVAGKDETLSRDVSFEQKSETPARFIGWDVLVRFKGSDDVLENYRDKNFRPDADCNIPTFRLRGQFKRKLAYSILYAGDRYDGTYFDANRAAIVYKGRGGCRQLGEVAIQ